MSPWLHGQWKRFLAQRCVHTLDKTYLKKLIRKSRPCRKMLPCFHWIEIVMIKMTRQPALFLILAYGKKTEELKLWQLSAQDLKLFCCHSLRYQLHLDANVAMCSSCVVTLDQGWPTFVRPRATFHCSMSAKSFSKGGYMREIGFLAAIQTFSSNKRLYLCECSFLNKI